MKFTTFATSILLAAPAAALCPFGFDKPSRHASEPTFQAGLDLGYDHVGTDNRPVQIQGFVDGLPSAPVIPPSEASAEYEAAMKQLDIVAVQDDLKTLMTTSQDWWPADYGNYGPFFIRLAWHCSGSYRDTDGRGGCSGGRQRFEPERSWEDNANLDKARRLLWPVKEKYGLGLSWGDLFVMAGTTAIQSMGGPTEGVCVGRVDDLNGARSNDLGPTRIQEKFAPCEVEGNCTAPLGSTAVGLIYVNPTGPMGVPNPEGSAPEVRDTFARMAMTDRETVALIGGGHSFGKAHGACTKGPGLAPLETEALGLDADTEAWQGGCGSGSEKGIGVNTVTSGIEGAWTSNPTSWDNDYFKNLLKWEWEVHTGPGGAPQWRIANEKARNSWSAKAPSADGTAPQDIMMMTSDIALISDPAYMKIVQEFAQDQSALDEAFAAAWHKLTTRAFGSQTAPRCVGPATSSAQVYAHSLRGGETKATPTETQCAASSDSVSTPL